MDGYDWSFSGSSSGSQQPEPSPAGGERPELPGFTILDELGRGGMGIVYRAFTDQGGEVALKVVKDPDLSESRRARFKREGEVTYSLQHPNIVQLVDGGELGGKPWLAYELVRGGRSLEEAFGQAPLGQRVTWLRDAARGVGHAHQRGIVHRDLKPDNVLVDEQGIVRVTDFGLAAARGLEKLTQTGAMVGTPTHMAPEQLKGHRDLVAPPVDVWSLGVLLYQALTGELPFQANTLVQLAVEIDEGLFRRPSTLDPTVPVALEDVCDRALDPNPAGRYPDADAFADDLESWLAARPVSASGMGPVFQGNSPLLLGILALAAVIIIITLLAISLPSGVDSAGEDAPDETQDPTPLTKTPPPVRKTSELPAWFESLPRSRRPRYPFPPGIRFGDGPQEYVNKKDGSVLVWVPPGIFMMGYRAGLPSERPVHEVQLTRGFFMGKYEVTIGQYHAYCDATKRKKPPKGEFSSGDRYPVYFVSWFDAREYCRWANLRLPTEAQWEFAARGPENRLYPWGDEPDASRCNVAGENDKYRNLSPVGRFPRGASPFGCLDMAGNVFEWVLDGSANYLRGPKVNPFRDYAPAPARPIRGGGFNAPLEVARSTYRDAPAAPQTWTPFIGFRVCRPVR